MAAVALCTGAGSGIGRATALALAGRGASVVCGDAWLSLESSRYLTGATITVDGGLTVRG